MRIKILNIYRQTLHFLLVNFERNSLRFGFFSRKSPIRSCFESLRGDLEKHEKESYQHMYDLLNKKEMTQLINGLITYINTTKDISDFGNVDNDMIHTFMCQSLLWYELNNPTANDSFRQTVNTYFYALNKKLKLIDKLDGTTPLNIWLQHFIEHPEAYIGHLFINGNGNSYEMDLLNLSECGCVDISHDRLLSDLRLQTERRIIEECIKLKSSNPKNPIKILSFGTGEGLQDFLIILKLFNLGIRNIELTFVEREYKGLLEPEQRFVYYWDKNWKEKDKLPQKYLVDHESRLYSITRALSLLTKKFSDANLTISQYVSVEQLKKEKRHQNSYDIIQAIDLDDYDEAKSDSYQDFHALAGFLKHEGVAVLSHHYKLDEFNPVNKDHDSLFNLVKTTQHTKTEPKINDDKIYYSQKHSMQSFTKFI